MRGKSKRLVVRVAATMAALLAMGCVGVPAPGAVKKPVVPVAFSAGLGGFLGSSSRVTLQEDGTLLYQHHPHTFAGSPGTSRKTIRVTEEQWRLFRNEVDAARVWGWKARYENPAITDGTQWFLELRYSDGKSIKSAGSNRFPAEKNFTRYAEAVRRLTGETNFR